MAFRMNIEPCSARIWDPPAFFFYQFLLFAVFHAVRLVLNAGMPSRTPTDQLPIPMYQDKFTTFTTLSIRPFTQRSVNANWSSWTSQFEPSRIKGLQSSSRNLLTASEGLILAQSVLTRQNRPQVPKP